MSEVRNLFWALHYQRYPIPAFFLGATCIVYLFWKVWRFFLVTVFYPGVPRELPYWTPGKWDTGRCVIMLQDSYLLI